MIALEKRVYKWLERRGISLAAQNLRFFSSGFKIYEYQELVAGTNLNQDQRILDLGCGFGRQSQLLARQVKALVGLDVTEKSIANARKLLRFSPVKDRIQYVLSPLETAGFAAESFDRIISFCVLEHIPNLTEVLQEAYKILKADGELHVTVDSLATITDEATREIHRRENAVIQYFTVESLRETLEKAGFELFELRAIMQGDLARREFEHRIIKGSRLNFFNRMAFSAALREEDHALQSPDGLMLLARARKKASHAQ